MVSNTVTNPKGKVNTQYEEKYAWWMKVRLDLFEDVDFTLLSEKAALSYLHLYTMAMKAGAGGLIGSPQKPFNLTYISRVTHKTEAEMRGILDELIEAGFVLDIGEYFQISRYWSEQAPSTRTSTWEETQRKKYNLFLGLTQEEDEKPAEKAQEPKTETKAPKMTKKPRRASPEPIQKDKPIFEQASETTEAQSDRSAYLFKNGSDKKHGVFTCYVWDSSTKKQYYLNEDDYEEYRKLFGREPREEDEKDDE